MTYLLLFFVSSSALASAACTSGGRSWVLPTVFILTPYLQKIPLTIWNSEHRSKESRHEDIPRHAEFH